MLTNFVNRILLDIPNEPNLIPGSSSFAAPKDVWVPETWIEVLSTNILQKQLLLNIWESIAKFSPRLVEKIVEYTVQIALALYPENKANLIYIFQLSLRNEETDVGEKDIIVGWSAGYPANEKEITVTEKKLNIILPESYKQFLRVHNGFNLYPLDLGPRPLQKLYFLSEIESLDDHHSYRLDKQLAFSGDGAGNEQCYNLDSSISNRDYLTYDWDHESNDLTNPMIFWDYLEKLILTELRNARPRVE